MSTFNPVLMTEEEPSAHRLLRAVDGFLKPSSRRPSREEGGVTSPRVRRSSKDEPSTSPIMRALAHSLKPATTDTVCAL